MISRRNIRVKVMQLLYMMDTAMGVDGIKNPVAELQKTFEKTKELLVYLIYFITEVARYAETDALRKSKKHLPSIDDLNVNTKLSGNNLFWEIMENSSYLKAFQQMQPQKIISNSILKKVYNNLTQTSEYRLYIEKESRDKNEERKILLFIFTDMMLPNEVFTLHLEELFNNWEDDCDMVEQIIISYLNNPSNIDLQEIISDDKWEFARILLESTYNKRKYLSSIIAPKLQNWDPDRIASLDMVLMQMGVCEFLYFETIPTKVTINEYIDLAKAYSTDQSGHFINGILDNIHKELIATEKISKVDFKQKK